MVDCVWDEWQMGMPAPPQQVLHSGSFAARQSFVPAEGIEAKILASGGGRTCAIVDEGVQDLYLRVWCWGEVYGQGDWSHHKPHVVGRTDGAMKVAVSREHGCIVEGDHHVLCWGFNTQGELGNGSIAADRTPSRGAWPVRF
jgi:hypothetical protein